MNPTEGSDDAEIEPAAGLSPEKAAVAAGMPPVAVHKARSRERVRNVVSIAIVTSTVVCGGLIAAAALAGSSRADEVADLVFTPLLGLSGAIVGFYFGGQDSTA